MEGCTAKNFTNERYQSAEKVLGFLTHTRGGIKYFE